MRFFLIIILFLLSSCGTSNDSTTQQTIPENINLNKDRVFITTDLGGLDADDTQSLIHLLLYSDMVSLEGLVAGWRAGKMEKVLDVIDHYSKDYEKLLTHSPDYPTPDYLQSITRQGSLNKTSDSGFIQPTSGSNFLIEQVYKNTNQPLHVLVWGSLTDLAQAIHDDPGIKNYIKVYSIGTWNTRQDELARKYLKENHTDFFWVETDSTARGIYLGGIKDTSKYGNVRFVKEVIKPSGALGAYFYKISEPINVNKFGIKMGDTPSFLFLLTGGFNNPSVDSWGGKLCQVEPLYWYDCLDPQYKLDGYPGAKTIDIHRMEILKDFELRLQRLQ